MTNSFGAGGNDFWLFKLNEDETIAWQKVFGGGLDDVCNSVAPTADGGYIAAGDARSFSGFSPDLWLTKLKADGVVEWQKCYGSGANEWAVGVKQTRDDGFVVVGVSGYFSDYRDVWVLRLDRTGNCVWQKTYGGAGHEYGNGIDEAPDGSFYVAAAATSFSGNLESCRVWVLKVAPDGSVAWQKGYAGNYFAQARNIATTSDGGCIVAAELWPNGYGPGEDILVLKLSPEGTVEWQKVYAGSAEDAAGSICQTADGGYLLSANSLSFGTGKWMFWVLKLTSSGAIEWQKAFGGGGNSFGRSVFSATDGGYLIAGETRAFGSGNADAWLLKLNPDGTAVPNGQLGPPDLVIDTNVVARDLDGAVQDTHLPIRDTPLGVSATSAVASDTFATISQQSPQTWSPAKR